MKWEKMDNFARENGKIISQINRVNWSCNAALDWAAVEEIAAAECGETVDDRAGRSFDLCKRDVFYLAGWFARGQRYWNQRGGDVDPEQAAVSAGALLVRSSDRLG